MSYSSSDFVDDVCDCIDRNKLGSFDATTGDEDCHGAKEVVLNSIYNLMRQRDALVAALEQASSFIADQGDDKSDEEMELLEEIAAALALALAKGE